MPPTLRRSIIVQGGLITSTGVVLVVLVLVFVVPGVVFSVLVAVVAVSYTHLRAHETKANLVCRLLLEKKKGRRRRHFFFLF